MTEKTLAERLRIKAGVMEMGGRISFGSDTALMREAADAIDVLENQIRLMSEKLDRVAGIEFQIGETF